MLKVDVTQGGRSGPAGGCFVYAPAHGLGVAFEDAEENYTAIARLLDNVETKTGEQAVLGALSVKIDSQAQGTLLDGDRRKAVAPKPKRKHPRKRQSMQDYAELSGWDD